MVSFGCEIKICKTRDIKTRPGYYEIVRQQFDIRISCDETTIFKELERMISFIFVKTNWKISFLTSQKQYFPLDEEPVSIPQFQNQKLVFDAFLWSHQNDVTFSCFDPDEIVMIHTIKAIQPLKNTNHFFVFKTLESVS
jgi:hypothetical protein